MKYSFYNLVCHFSPKKVYLLNALSGNLAVLQPELYKILKLHVNHIDEIKNIHPSFYQYLVEESFILPNEVNEQKQCLENLHKLDINDDRFMLIVNPTLDCNLRCWYCYEEHLKGSTMSDKLVTNIELFVEKTLKEKRLKHFQLSFFGGEPLMKFNEVVLPLIRSCKQLCQSYNVRFSFDFTSNAVLLSPKRADILLKENIPFSLQVPFDGNETLHNKTKKKANGKGTYRIMKDNVEYALSKGVRFSIRCNCTNENVDSFKELIDEFKNIRQKDLISFNLQEVWQEERTAFLRDKINELSSYIYKNFPSHYTENIRLVNRCYADRLNSCVVNYDGSIFKCTAGGFENFKSEGKLNNDGTITYNERHKNRMLIKNDALVCKICKLLPICEYCTQHKLKNCDDKGFFKGCSIEEKEEMIRNKVLQLL